MPKELSIRSLTRSLSDAETLVNDGGYTPPSSSKNKAPHQRAASSFSWSKLTESFKGHRREPRSSPKRNSRSKRSISNPFTDPRSPLCPPTENTPVEWVDVTPVSSVLTAQSSLTTQSSPRRPTKSSTSAPSGHSHSASDPTNNHSPPYPSRRALRTPPSIPAAPSFGSLNSTLDSPLERINESPLEQEHFEDFQTGLTCTRRRLNMEPARLQPPGMAGTKSRAIQQAKEMEILVAERAKRSGDEPPPYDFYELIGKGAYGRVFKGKSRKTGYLVAIKIIDIDKVDYEEMTTKNLSETLKEIDILQQLRDSKARPYVNIIEEARPVHNELWIVSEYASGGSVNTLMKPTLNLKNPGPGLPEKFIIPIARELALGLKYIHEAGVLHRDLKCNNVLILEDGRVQLCDFGVSGTLEPQKSKRTTIVGTPYWMAPELQREWVKDAAPHSILQPNEIHYGSEVDIWAYGCTVYEMACGLPPHHRVVQWDLPTAGVPELEGDRFSPELKDFVAFLLRAEAKDRPTPDQILEHPYIAGSTKMYPTVTLVRLVEEYYKWEQGGGARASLFNPFGAQAPDPLAPELEEDEDDDWTFSTSEEFEQVHAPQFADPFAGSSAQGFGIGIPPVQDMGRFEQLQAKFKEESIVRGQKRLNRLFDKDSTPYRYSVMEEEPAGQPPSDLVLRDFNPGAPNRETVIDLDFSMPSADEIPSIDLGEVPTIKANRMKSIIREMEEEEARELEAFREEDELTKRATKDWTFPSMTAPANRNTMDWGFPSEPAEPSNRTTMEFSFPAQPAATMAVPSVPKVNRRTVEWTFDAAMAEANNGTPRNRMSRRRDTQESSNLTVTSAGDRKTRDFQFPMRSSRDTRNGSSLGRMAELSSSPTEPNFRPSLRHAATEPFGGADDFPRVSSSPDSPLRTSMIDLDMANVESFRPSTAGSGSTYTASAYAASENPFSLEDQVQLSQNNHRASYHMKSQSEPNHAVPGLLTPQQYDEAGQPTTQDIPHSTMHARGVSSASQVQSHIKSLQQPFAQRAQSRPTHAPWETWSHAHAFGLGSNDHSPPVSVKTDTSQDDEDIDDLWDNFERAQLPSSTRRNPTYAPPRSARRTNSSSRDLAPAFGLAPTHTPTGLPPLDSDTDDTYPHSSSSTDDTPGSQHASSSTSRVSAGPNGRPLVDFPMPRGPEMEKLMGMGMGMGAGDGRAVADMLLRSARELRDGVRASRDLLRAMRLEEVEEGGGGGRTGTGTGAGAEDGDGMDTVRLVR